MAIDFRKTSHSAVPTIIKGTSVERMDCFKCLGTVVDKNIDFDLNSTAVCKKGLPRLYFVQRLDTFNRDRTLMVSFYRSFIESILTFCLVSWYGNLSMHNKNHLSSIMKTASKIISTQQPFLSGTDK